MKVLNILKKDTIIKNIKKRLQTMIIITTRQKLMKMKGNNIMTIMRNMNCLRFKKSQLLKNLVPQLNQKSQIQKNLVLQLNQKR